MREVYIIAEVGVNHNGDFNLAKKLVDEAKKSKVNAIKFQTFNAENLVTKFAEKAYYQKKSTDCTETQLDMLSKLSLTYNQFKELKTYCDKIEIDFLSTPFDLESIHFLNELNIPLWKIPSGEVTNLPYLLEIAQTRKPIILSTGMCEINEIREALQILSKNGSREISLLHCNTEYPTPFKDANLKAIGHLREVFGEGSREGFNCKIGYSDHTLGMETSLAAVALGATIIEKHFTLDKNMDGPDHKASLDPHELALMVDSIRNVEEALGDGRKKVMPSEKGNREVARKSIVALIDINTGQEFTAQNITTKRPGNGISPMEWFNVLGKKAKKDFKEDELIEI